MITNKQRKRAERARLKEARRRDRREAEWKKQRQHARALPPPALPAARPPRMALAAGLAATVALVALDPYMRPKENL